MTNERLINLLYNAIICRGDFGVDGDAYMSFMLSIKDDGTIDVIKESNCSLADVDGDYIFNTDNSLYRIQADEPISEDKYEEIWDCYNEHQ